MKKIGLFIQMIMLVLGFSACEKDPYAAADDIRFEKVYHVLNQEWSGGGEMIQFQSKEQKAILPIDEILHLYVFLDMPQIVSYSAVNYKGCKIEEISNFKNLSEEGVDYHVTFDRAFTVDTVEHILSYEIFYDLDRNYYYRQAYDENGKPKADANGTPIMEKYQKPTYMVVRNADGVELSREDRVNVLIENRAIEK